MMTKKQWIGAGMVALGAVMFAGGAFAIGGWLGLAFVATGFGGIATVTLFAVGFSMLFDPD